MHVRNKYYPTYMAFLKMTLLKCAKGASRDSSPKTENIYRNSHSTVESSIGVLRNSLYILPNQMQFLREISWTLL